MEQEDAKKLLKKYELRLIRCRCKFLCSFSIYPNKIHTRVDTHTPDTNVVISVQCRFLLNAVIFCPLDCWQIQVFNVDF